MKIKLLIITFVFTFTGCYNIDPRTKWEKMGYTDYTDYTVADFNKLKHPVVLIGKNKSLGEYSIVVKDVNDTIRYYGNLSSMASAIGYSHNVGDTLK